MNDFIQILENAIGRFVADDAGIYKGQCPQLPRYLAMQCGMEWPGRTYNGNKLVDRIYELGGYYAESHLGYRICSCDVAGSEFGHTWVEVKINGEWTIYEQNANRAGAVASDFGCGTVYSVTKTTNPGSWRKNIRYAAHPLIDQYIIQHTPAAKVEEPKEEVVEEPKETEQKPNKEIKIEQRNYSDFKTFAIDAGERAAKTFAQTLLAQIAIDGAGFGDFDWLRLLSISGVASVVSILTSIVSANFGESNSASLVK